MAKIFKSLLSVFLAVFMVVSLAAIPSSAAMALSKSSITLTKGYQTTISVTGTSKAVTWSTGDKSIATVNSSGKVVGKAPGTTYVYAKVGGTTLKCKVTVVAAKITASASSVTFNKKGETKTVTVTVKGSHSGITVGTTDKSVATASWAKPVQWNGDKISYVITAQNPGTARIKVYLKNYPDTCCNYVNVTVKGSSSSNNSNNSNNGSGNSSMIILTNPKDSVDVSSGGTANITVYSTNQSNLAYSVADTNIAAVSAGVTSGYYRDFTVKGLKDGTTTLRFYDKNNTSTYYDVRVNVSSSTYYEFYTTTPTKNNMLTDKVITIQANYNTTYYMLVPENYDPAYVNSLVAKKFGSYSYYYAYLERPTNINSSDRYYEFYHTNKKYNYGPRYILVPNKYDTARLDTAIADYNEVYDYWTVYTASPEKISATDILETWTIVDPSTAKNMTRYMLVPAIGYDYSRITTIKENDIANNSSYSYYVGYSTWPTVNNDKDKIIAYRKDNTTKYMVVPSDNSGIAKANDAIAKDTGIYEYNVIYSVQPTAANGEKVINVQSGNSIYYVLIKSEDNVPDAYVATRYADGYKDN